MKMFSLLSKKTRVLLLATSTLVLFFAAVPSGRTGQSNEMWQSIEERSLDTAAKRLIVPSAYRTVRLNQAALVKALAQAPMEFTLETTQNPAIIYLPMPDGTMARFRFEESPIMEPGLAAKFPTFKTYRAQGIDDPTASCRFDSLPSGFHAMILAPSGTVLIDPYAEGNTADYISYWKKDAASTAHPFVCGFKDSEANGSANRGEIAPTVTSGTQLRTYRLALACTNEYVTAVGCSTRACALAAEVLIMNRVNGVYERDLAIHMNIVANNILIIYAGDNMSCGGPCNAGNDPYTNDEGGIMLGQNQTVCDNVIGSANYDIGHVFSTGGGGLAGLGVVCAASKAQGESGLANPIGDTFAIDIVAHVMGHQYGANHTFNGLSGNCAGGNRVANAAYEPGSGITIMAYAGICSNQDLATHSIDTFHVKSLEEIFQYTQSGTGNSCPVTTATNNTPPTVTGPAAFTIPKKTPFTMTASATDPNGDSITYDWEEYDLGPGTAATPNTDSDGLAKPIFRPFAPTVGGTRTFPSMQYILNNANVPPTFISGFLAGELLPAISRTMTFQVVARDNRANGGGINSATATVTVDGNSGPFAVTFPNTPTSVQVLTNLNVTWNVAGTAGAPVNAANVKISLSTDGGATFSTVLAASTPNDGSESVLIPNTPTTTARIKIEGVGNIFFDISDTNFNITTGAPTPTPAPTPSPMPTSTPTPPPLTVSLPIDTMDVSVPISTIVVKPVTCTMVTASQQITAFQGDFLFDSAVINFNSIGSPTSPAGMTATNWNVSANVINGGPGTIKTLRVSAFSTDMSELSGSGTLFNLNMVRVSSTAGAASTMNWQPAPDNFVFFTADFNTVTPIQNNGLITIRGPINISGTISYCSNPVPGPVAGVTVTLTGSASASTVSDSAGNYSFSGLPSGGSYTVTATKADRVPGTAGVNTSDVIAVRNHFLQISSLTGCRLTAANVVPPAAINTQDVNAIQHFFLGLTSGFGVAGKYQFSPASRTYSGVVSNQTGQNYDALIFGDVASHFVERPGGPSQDAALVHKP